MESPQPPSPSTSEEITRKSASNLALAFVLLPRDRRRAMEVLYAFCREVDDVADDESVPVEVRRESLKAWRQDLDRVYSGDQSPRFQVNRELVDVLKHFDLKQEDFHALLDGVESDLVQNRLQTRQDLEMYCYRVASAVGLLSIPIFGFTHDSARQYAINLGKALQITNILRDVKTDAELNRIYLPLDELENFGVTESQILNGEYSPAFHNLSRFYAGKALGFYTAARNSLDPSDRPSMIASELMGAVYWEILRKLTRRHFNHWDGHGRTRLTKFHKIFLILRTWFNLKFRPGADNYGTGAWARSFSSSNSSSGQ